MARKAPAPPPPARESVRINKAATTKVAATTIVASPRRPKVGPVISPGNNTTPERPKPSPKPIAKPVKPTPAPALAKGAMTRVRKITVQPIQEEDESGDPQPIKINIEGVDSGEGPSRRVKRAPRPPEPEDDDGPKAAPKPISRVAAMAQRTVVKPPIADETEEFVGARFVRMLNRDNRVIGVTAGFVGERMMEGYRFIEGEPTIPTRVGPDDRVPGMKKIRPRDYPHPENLFNALEIWRLSMLDDMDNVEKLIEPQRLIGRDCAALVRRLGRVIENPAELGHVYGEMPRGDIAKSLGFGG